MKGASKKNESQRKPEGELILTKGNGEIRRVHKGQEKDLIKTKGRGKGRGDWDRKLQGDAQKNGTR